MRWFSQIRRRLAVLFRGSAFDSDLEEEMRSHLEMQAEENEAGGMSANEAYYAARRQFGNATLFQETSREAWGWRWVDEFAHDVRYAARGIMRSPGFAAVAIITLALGAGANTAMFSVLYGTCLAPLPFADPDRLVDVSMLQVTGHKFDAGTSMPNLREWKAQSVSFERLGTHRQQFFVNLTGHGDAEEVHAWRLSSDLMRVLGVPPALGRWFVPEEDTAAGPRSALLAYHLWQSRFGGDPNVVGQQVFVDGEAHTIIGVMPPRFAFPPLIGTWNPVIWLSLNLPDEKPADERARHSLSVAGRLKPGVSVESARAEMNAIAGRLAKAFPKENGEWPAAKVTRLSDDERMSEFRSTLWLLLGAAGLVLLIACANIASLLLARGASREREFAIRRALGVSRWRLARQLLTESCLIAGIGCALGVALAFWSLPVLRSLLETQPRVDEIAIRPAVLAFAAGIALLTGILFGAGPAVRAGRIDPALKQSGRSSPRQRSRKALVAVEIALALLLVSAAGLLLESFWRVMHNDLGFRPEHVLTMRFNLPKRKYDTGRRVEAFREELLRRVSALPGVEYAGTNSAPPMGVLSQGTGFQFEGAPEPSEEARDAAFANVSPDYLRAMGIAVLRGRHFQAADRPGTPPVAIVSESVERLFPGGRALGRRVRLDRFDNPEWVTIIGVVRDIRWYPDSPAAGAIYALSSQLPESAQGNRAGRFIVLAVRTAVDPGGVARAARAIVAEIDKDQPVAEVKTMYELVARHTARRRLNALLVGVFGGLALTLATIGVFGLVSYSVACRTNEIGVRMALGARRSNILGMVTREALALSTAGVAAGIAGSLASSRLIASMLYGVKPAAPHILIAAASFLVIATMAATLIGARKAMRVDPVIALRHE